MFSVASDFEIHVAFELTVLQQTNIRGTEKQETIILYFPVQILRLLVVIFMFKWLLL